MSVAEERQKANRMLMCWWIHSVLEMFTYHLGWTHTHTCFQSETKEVASISHDFKWRCLVGMVSGCVIWSWAVTANLRWGLFLFFISSPNQTEKKSKGPSAPSKCHRDAPSWPQCAMTETKQQAAAPKVKIEKASAEGANSSSSSWRKSGL